MSMRMYKQFVGIFLISLILIMPIQFPMAFADENNAPSDVTNLVGVALSSSSIQLDWDESTETDFSLYQIYRNYVLLTTTTENQFIDTGLEYNYNYRYEIAPVDTFGNVGSKTLINVLTQPLVVDTPVISNIAMTSESGLADISFNTDQDTTAEILYGETSLSESVSSTELSSYHRIEIDSLSDDIIYKYKIKVCNEYMLCAESAESMFKPGVDTTPPQLNFELPEMSQSNYLSLSGQTEPYVTFVVYVDDVIAFQTTSDSLGNVQLNNIQLNSEGSTHVKITATDLAGNTVELEENIAVDSLSPELSLITESATTRDNSIVLEGSVSETVNLNIIGYMGAIDTTGPEQVQRLESELISHNSRVRLEWLSSDADDFQYYIIYRNGLPIAKSLVNRFTDEFINSGIAYTYQVASVDDYCNIGMKSDSVSLEIPDGSTQSEDPFYVDNCEITPLFDETVPTGDFSKTIQLSEGKNVLVITITDSALNMDSKTIEIVRDNEIPLFLDDNLDELSPSYVNEITLQGEMNEECDIEIIVNEGATTENGYLFDHEKTYSTSTELVDGKHLYTQSIDLSRIRDLNLGDNSLNNMDPSWENKIKITATDLSGLENTKESNAVYASCDNSAGDWSIDFGTIMPSEIVPRMLLDGFSSIGLNFELEYIGLTSFDGDDEPNIQSVRLEKQELSVFDNDNYDLDWISRIDSAVMSDDYKRGYINIALKGESGLGLDFGDKTTKEKENMLSDNHKGSCISVDRTIGISTDIVDFTGIGCVKLPLILVVEYEGGLTQKKCIDLMMMIQPNADIESWIPEGLLNASIDVIDDLLRDIEKIKEPLATAVDWTTKGCLISWGVWWLSNFNVLSNCGLEGIISEITGIDISSFTVALENGKAVVQDDEEGKKQKCFDAKVDLEGVVRTMRYICDRAMCPATPSFEEYVKQSRGKDNSFCKNYDEFYTKESYDKDMENDGIEDIETFEPMHRVLAGTTQIDGTPWSSVKSLCEEEYLFEWKSSCLFQDPYKKSFCKYAKSSDVRPPPMDARYGTECGVGFQFTSIIDQFNGCNYFEVEEVAYAVQENPNYYYYIKRADSSLPSVFIAQPTGEIPVKDGYLTEPSNYLETIRQLTIDCEDCKDGGCTQNLGISPGLEMDIRIPNTVINEVCISNDAEQYVFDPTSGFLDAFLCGCVTAMQTYVAQFEKVLRWTKGCFEAIVLTGEGSAGVCQEALSTYLCDIIYYIIGCVENYASAGFGKGLDPEMNIFQLVSQSGASVQNGIESRYGGSNMYKALFVDKTLVNSVCIFFITGNWPLDFSDLAAEVGAPPAKPIVSGLGTRRFQAYNPINGYATYLYTISPLIIPGSKLDYKIELVCSADHSCGGACDCTAYGSEKVIPITSYFSGAGQLSSSGTLSESQYVLIDSVTDTNNAKIRYDKLRITTSYDYNDQDNTDVFEQSILEEGGSAPVECELDIYVGEFKCSSFMNENGVSYFVDEPTPDKDKYYLGDIVEFTPYRIFKESPSSSNPLTKYLRIEIETDNGNVVNWRDGNSIRDFAITSDGYVTKSEPTFRIEEHMLRGGSGSSSGCDDNLGRNMPIDVIDCPTSNMLIFPINENDDHENLVYVEGKFIENVYGADRDFELNYRIAKKCDYQSKRDDILIFKCGNSEFKIYEASYNDLSVVDLENVIDTNNLNFVNSFDFIDDFEDQTHAFIKVTSASAPYCPDHFKVTMTLLHEDENYAGQATDTSVYWNGNEQKKEIILDTDCSTRPTEEVDTSGNCVSNQVNENPSSCSCGSNADCAYGEMCCARSGLESSGYVGYCFTPDSTIRSCDTEYPQSNGKIQVDATNPSIIEFNFDMYDVAKNGEKISPNIYGSVNVYASSGYDCTKITDEYSRDLTPRYLIPFNALAEESYEKRAYSSIPISIPMRTIGGVSTIGKTYAIVGDVYDSYGNSVPSEPLYVTVKSDGFKFYASPKARALYEISGADVEQISESSVKCNGVPGESTESNIEITYDLKPTSVSANSKLSDGSLSDYKAENTVDNNIENPWCSDETPFNPTREALKYTFSTPVNLESISIANGYQRLHNGLDLYSRNGRAKNMEISLIDSSGNILYTSDWILNDVKTIQQKSFGSKISGVKDVVIYIDNKYDGTNFEELCISEVYFNKLPSTA